MRRVVLPLFLLLLASGLEARTAGGTGALSAEAGTLAFDKLLEPHFRADQAGASVLVMRDGKVLYARGFGLANVELKVPNAPNFVYRIGSVTKHFTAAAIMTLVEDGKVALDAPVSRYLDGLPQAWRAATVQQLLTHTSGIPSYTDQPEYGLHMREDMPGLKLLETLVWKQPMDFAPGTSWHYNNTGYYLLGLIVEKASGQTYAEYLKGRFFGPLGLAHTCYGKETDFIPGMVSGYAVNGRPAPYLSMSQPYAAGALVSSSEDLARWTLALHGGKVLKPASLKLMTSPVKTSDGKEHPYGFGLMFRESQGHRLIGHGGSVNGFTSYVEADPATQSAAIVLFNSDGPSIGGEFLCRRLLALAAGKPIVEPAGVAVAPDKLSRLVGSYQHEGARRTITLVEGRLKSHVGGGLVYDLIPLSEERFLLKGTDMQLRFEVEGQQALGVHRQPVGGVEEALAKKVPAEVHMEVNVDPAAFDALAGTYQLAPNFELRVWREENRYLTQATGQGVIEIYPESETHYFVKIIDAQLDFVKGAGGKAEQLILTQGGRKMPAKRVK